MEREGNVQAQPKQSIDRDPVCLAIPVDLLASGPPLPVEVEGGRSIGV